ncbi:hypothetical protein HKD37_15G043113 [Glycine soja]
MTKGLSGLMREAKRNNTFNGYLVRIDNVERGILKNVLCIKSMMRSFELFSRLKVNFHKSYFRIIGEERGVVEIFADHY